MFYLNFISIAREPYGSRPFALAVIAIRFVLPTANFIYPLEESRIFYDTSEGVAANRSSTHSVENHAYDDATSLRKIAPLRSRDGVILFEEIGNSNRCHIFLMEYETPCDAWLALFCKSRKNRKGLFSWSGNSRSLDVFQWKIAKGSKGR